jgi:hypothetical protein
MDFVKKNIGLLLFLILCLGGIVYLVILIMGQSKLKQEQLSTEKQHVEFFDRLAKENLRLNDENRKKAEGKLAEADKKYVEFRQSLAEKRLVKDDDPDCKAFMQLAPAPAQSEMLVMIEKIFTDNFVKRRMTSMGGDMMGGMGGEPEMMEPDMMGMGGNGMMGMGMQQMRARQAEEKSDTPKKHLLIQGAKVTPYLCFDRYAQMKNGLNKDDMQRIYKQLKVVELVIGLIRQSEVRELQEFDLPKSIEKLEEGDYEWTPMTITVVGKQANVQILLNLLSSNENYFFFIRNLELKAQDVLMDQIIEMKQALAREMPALLASGTSRGGGGMMSMGEPGTSDTMMMGGMEMEEGMGGMGGRGGRRGGRRRRRPPRPGVGGPGMGGNAMGGPGMMNPGMGGPGMMNPGMGGGEMMGEGMGGGMDPYDLIPLTRRDLRVFDSQKDVTMTIRFDLIEFNPMAENN